jgi:hypothetical protein
MADRREVGVDLITRLKDKGFKDLQKQTSRTEKQLQKFGRRLTAVFSVAVIGKFIKGAINEFSEGEKAIKRLRLELDNLGLGFAAGFANEFVKTLSLASGIADDTLNPALQRLVQTTYTLTDAQKLLTLSVDISKRTGKDLNSITIALQRAYLGQTTSLSKLNIGYTTATLKGKDFEEILADLQKRYGGGALATQDDFATSIDRLKVAFDEAREAIGEGFIKGLEESGMSVDEFIPKIIDLGDKIGKALGKAAGAIASIEGRLQDLADNPIIKTLIKLYGLLDTKSESSRLDEARKREAELAKAQAERYANSLDASGKLVKLAEEEARLAALRAKELKKLQAEEKRRAAEKKRSAELDRLRNAISFKFDIDAINQQAALRRNISKEDRDRVLQLAALKISDYQTDEDALVTLKAATTGLYDERMNLETVYQLLKAAGFATDKKAIETLAALNPAIKFSDNLDDIIAKLKALIEGKYFINLNFGLGGNGGDDGTGGGKKILKDKKILNTDTGPKTISDIKRFDTTIIDPSENVIIKPGITKDPFLNLPGEIGGEPLMGLKDINAPDTASFRYFEELTSSRLRNLYSPSAVPSNFDVARVRMGEEGVVVNVNVSGSLISQNDLVAAVTDAVYQTQRSGNSLLIAE